MRKRMLKRLKPSNPLKFLQGIPIVCTICGKAGGTLAKDGEGLYHHEPRCPDEQSPEMQAKLKELEVKEDD